MTENDFFKYFSKDFPEHFSNDFVDFYGYFSKHFWGNLLYILRFFQGPKSSIKNYYNYINYKNISG